jgi:hypothetical protein
MLLPSKRSPYASIQWAQLFCHCWKHLVTSVLRPQQMLPALAPELPWHYESSFLVQHVSVLEKEKYLGSAEDMGQESYHYWSAIPTQQSRERAGLLLNWWASVHCATYQVVVAIYHLIDMTICLYRSVGSQLVHVDRMCDTQFHVSQKKSNQHTKKVSAHTSH